ncbi:MAG: hypothetical protein J4N63_11390 [Chloroflexi bacterium]|nr:hypothetical protein [Chloroflexota bacterium]
MVNAVRTNAGSGAELGARLELLTVGQRLAVDQQQFPGEFDPGYANFSSDVDSGVIENHLQTEALASVAANLGILTEIPDGGQVLASARIPFDSPGDATGRFRQAAPLADAPPAPGETDSPGAAETPALHPQTGVAPSETLVSIVAGITGTPAPGNDDLHGTGGPNPVPKIEFTSNATSTEDRPGGDLPVGPSSGPSPDSPGSPGNAGSGSFGSSTGGVDTGNAKTADGSSSANTGWPTAEPASIYGPEQVEKKADGQPDEENDGDSVAGQADDGSTPDNHGRSGKRDTRGKRTDDSSTDSHAKGDDLDAPYAAGSGDEDPEYIDEPEQEEENDGDSVAGQAGDGSTPDNHGRSGKRDTRSNDSYVSSHAKDNGESSIATDTHETQVGHTQGDRRARN